MAWLPRKTPVGWVSRRGTAEGWPRSGRSRGRCPQAGARRPPKARLWRDERPPKARLWRDERPPKARFRWSGGSEAGEDLVAEDGDRGDRVRAERWAEGQVGGALLLQPAAAAHDLVGVPGDAQPQHLRGDQV